MSRHRFPIDDFIAKIADERGCEPEYVRIDDISVSAKRGEIVIDAHEFHEPRDGVSD